MIQIVDRWSVSAGLGAERLARCLEPTCDLAARGAEVFVGSSLRPRNRLDFELFVTVAGRERPAVPPLVVPDPPPPEEGLPPRRVYWVMVSGAVTIRW
jgi:hypothetical protein